MNSIGAVEILVLGFIVLVLVLCLVIPVWRILSRMGFPGPLALVTLIPLGSFVLLVVLAIVDWPVLRELRELKGRPTP